MNKLLRLLAAGACVLTPAAALADSDDDREAFFDETYFDDGYTGLGARSGPFAGQAVSSALASCAWHLNSQLLLGLRVEGLTSTIKPKVNAEGPINLILAGIFLEKILHRFTYVSLIATAFAGGGEIGYRGASGGPAATAPYKSTTLRQAELSLGGAIHLSHRIDLGLGFGYRKTGRLALEGVASNALSGTVTTIEIRGHF